MADGDERSSPATPPSSSPAKESSPTSVVAPLPASQIGLYASRVVKKKHSVSASGEHGVQTLGRAYVPHGTPQLWLGRKPLERTNLEDAEGVPAAADRFDLTERRSPWPVPDPTKFTAYDCKSRSVLRNFPRDALKSSEGRIARLRSGHGSMSQLMRSRSLPSLASHSAADELEVVLRPATPADVGAAPGGNRPGVAGTPYTVLNGRQALTLTLTLTG